KVRGLSPDLEAIVYRAIAKEKDKRYVTMKALADDIERYLQGERVSASRITFASELVRNARRRPLRLLGGAAAAALVVLVGVVIVVVKRRGESGPKHDPALDAAVEAEREAGRALEKMRSGKLAPSESLATSAAALAKLDEAAKAARTPAERQRL